MNLTTSFSDSNTQALPMQTLWKENFRRFWIIPVAAFLLYFLSGVLPIILYGDRINDLSDYILLTMNNHNPFFIMVHLFVPIVSSVTVFRYLHTSNSTTMIHSLPYKRKHLFFINYFSGLILSLIPVVLTYICFLLISKPVYYNIHDNFGTIIEKQNIFSMGMINGWFLHTILIIITVYYFSILAGMLSGTTASHFILSLILIFLYPALTGICVYYGDEFLLGFDSSAIAVEDLITHYSPLFMDAINPINGYDRFEIFVYFAFVGESIIAFIISLALYKVRDLEKTGENLVFPITIPIVCWLVTLFGMTFFGMFFKGILQGTHLHAYFGYIVGAVITFILARMAILRTTRIFNKESLKSFSIYAAVAVILLGALELDIFMFEANVPYANAKYDDSAWVSVDVLPIEDINCNSYDSAFLKAVEVKRAGMGFSLKEPENKAAVVGLHKDIIEKYKKNPPNPRDADYWTIRIKYGDEKDYYNERVYNVSEDFLASNENLNNIYKSQEMQSKLPLANIDENKVTNIRLFKVTEYIDKDGNRVSEDVVQGEGATEKIITDKAQIAEFINAVRKDRSGLSLKELAEETPAVMQAEVIIKDQKDPKIEHYYTLFLHEKYDKESLSWLKQHSFYK